MMQQRCIEALASQKVLEKIWNNKEDEIWKEYVGNKALSRYSMKITYDKEADALYIEFKHGKFAKNKKLDDFTILDLDKDGKILGIEFLDASKRIPKESLTEARVEKLLPAFK